MKLLCVRCCVHLFLRVRCKYFSLSLSLPCIEFLTSVNSHKFSTPHMLHLLPGQGRHKHLALDVQGCLGEWEQLIEDCGIVRHGLKLKGLNTNLFTYTARQFRAQFIETLKRKVRCFVQQAIGATTDATVAEAKKLTSHMLSKCSFVRCVRELSRRISLISQSCHSFESQDKYSSNIKSHTKTGTAEGCWCFIEKTQPHTTGF